MNILKSIYVYKISEQDDYKDGCIGSTIDHSYEHTIEGNTLAEIKQAICDHLGCDLSDLSVNPCEDEPNRIDAQFHETKDGLKATKSQYELFKQDDLRLWLVNYSFYFELVTVSPINLSEY